MEILTTRQMQVVCLVAEGKSNIEIGRELGIAPSSVKTNLELVCRKLKARNRTHVVHKAHLAGYFRGASRVQS